MWNDYGDAADANATDGVYDMQQHLKAADAMERLGRAGLHARAHARGKDDCGIVLWTLPFDTQLAGSVPKEFEERQSRLPGKTIGQGDWVLN